MFTVHFESHRPWLKSGPEVISSFWLQNNAWRCEHCVEPSDCISWWTDKTVLFSWRSSAVVFPNKKDNFKTMGTSALIVFFANHAVCVGMFNLLLFLWCIIALAVCGMFSWLCVAFWLHVAFFQYYAGHSKPLSHIFYFGQKWLGRASIWCILIFNFPIRDKVSLNSLRRQGCNQFFIMVSDTEVNHRVVIEFLTLTGRQWGMFINI